MDVNGFPCPLPPVGMANGEPSRSSEGVKSLCFLQPEVASLGRLGAPLLSGGSAAFPFSGFC